MTLCVREMQFEEKSGIRNFVVVKCSFRHTYGSKRLIFINFRGKISQKFLVLNPDVSYHIPNSAVNAER